MIIDELVEFSNYYGKNNDYVLAGGGNTSAKSGNVMYVKSSGTQLATIKAEQFVKIDLNKLSAIFEKDYPDDDKTREALVLNDLMDSRFTGEESKRPSVETMLHALFKQAFVLHLHPALVNGLTCSAGGEKLAKELFGDGIIWVDACKPGYILSKICFDKIKEFENEHNADADIILLQNHGIFIADNSVEGLKTKLDGIIEKLSSRLDKKPDAFSETYNSDLCGKISSVLGGKCVQVNSGDIDGFCKDYQSALTLIKPFTPDHIVYCNAYPLWLETVDELKTKSDEYAEKYGKSPKVIMIENTGIFCIAPDDAKLEIIKKVFEDAIKIAVYSLSFGGALNMSEYLTDFIVNWEVESYRSKQS